MVIRNSGNTIKKAICLGAGTVLLAVTLSAAAPGSTSGPSSRILQRKSSVYQYYAKNGHVPLRRVPVLDGGTKLTYVWIILGDPQGGGAYGSLYSPHLRKLLLTYPRGTIIENVKFGTDPEVIHRVLTAEDKQNEREGKDFSDFCIAHGFRFTEMPLI